MYVSDLYRIKIINDDYGHEAEEGKGVRPDLTGRSINGGMSGKYSESYQDI